MMPYFGVTRDEEESRYRQAACLLAGISWRAHPDYRGLQALKRHRHSSFVGITHAGPPFIALSNYYRTRAERRRATGPLATIATPQLIERAKLLGGPLACGLSLLGIDAGVVRKPSHSSDHEAPTSISIVVPPKSRFRRRNGLDGRLQQLAS